MATYERIDYGSPDGSHWGGAATDKLGFYGTTPVIQQSGATQQTSLVGTASSSDIDTATKAAIIAIMNTLKATGLWKGTA